MVDHILETPRLLVFGVKCFHCDTAKLNLQDNPAWNKDDIEVLICTGTPCSSKLSSFLALSNFLAFYQISCKVS